MCVVNDQRSDWNSINPYYYVRKHYCTYWYNVKFIISPIRNFYKNYVLCDVTIKMTEDSIKGENVICLVLHTYAVTHMHDYMFK